MKDKERKRLDDAARKAEHGKLTTLQKIEKVQARNKAIGGQSKKELTRLYAILNKEQAAAKEAADRAKAEQLAAAAKKVKK